MRLNNRNKQAFWYALYDATVDGYDGTGEPGEAPICGEFYCGTMAVSNGGTGYQISTYATYKAPVQVKGIISPAKGSVFTQPFGVENNYDKVIALENRDTPIDEYAVLWIDTVPELNANGTLKVNANGEIVTPWDYIVRRVGRGLPTFGGAILGVQKVNVS